MQDYPAYKVAYKGAGQGTGDVYCGDKMALLWPGARFAGGGGAE